MGLFQHLTSNTTLLTPNRRLSASLLKRYQQFQIAQQKSCWQTLDVLPFSSWLQRLWHHWAIQHNQTPLLLNTHQEHVLWNEIVAQSPESDHLLQLSAAAELAKSAWDTLKQWQVDIHDPALKTTEDSQAFQQWAKQFEKGCKKNKWLDTHSLPGQIIEKICSGLIIPPEKIILIGFTEVSPLYQQVLATCAEAGSNIVHHHSSLSNNTMQRISLADEETEIVTMARWAKTLFDADKTASIGCIIPNLDKIRDQVVQAFSDVFAEKNSYILNPLSLPFNISAGKCLTDYPVIYTALELLSLHTGKITIELLSNLLRSPFLGAAEKEMANRAQLESTLRKSQATTFELTKLIDKNNEMCLEKHCPALAHHIKNFLATRHHTISVHSLSEWSIIFMEQLTAFGWPGERSVNSQEYQVIHAWLELFAEYRKLDHVLAPQTIKQALHYLKQLTAKMIFQPQSPDAPVQILGLLEAADIPFDHAWIMGLDDTTWPPLPKPNPFIPQQMQKKLHMPHATAERELTYCRLLLTQLKNSAQHITFSHALKNNDAELRPSALIEDIPEINSLPYELVNFASPSQLIYQSQLLEDLHDETAPPIAAHENIQGGTKIFKHQAACPFKAFAELRLHAKKLELPGIGLRALDRGNIIHKVLELFWQELGDKANLMKQSEDELKTILQKHIQQALYPYAKEIKNSRYFALESQRLEKILWKWVDIEKSRPDFKVVSQEQETEMTIANIPLTIRVDRIDELEHGHKLIIDYKTGKNADVKDWFGDRPDEPQLPLYCLAHPEHAVGILFAQINREETKLKGISKIPLQIKSVKTIEEYNDADTNTWEQQLQQWQHTLEKLGHDFCAGDAKVDPKKPKETCEHCDLKGLCRIYENNLLS